MKKEEFIKRRGKAAYEKKLQQGRDWSKQHREECNARVKEWRAANPEKVLAIEQEQSHKGGKHYEKRLEYNRTGLQGERKSIRDKHRKQYHAISQATPNSALHHQWIPGTANYLGVALVDKELHRRGIIKVIKLLEGQITVFTEKEIRGQE